MTQTEKIIELLWEHPQEIEEKYKKKLEALQ